MHACVSHAIAGVGASPPYKGDHGSEWGNAPLLRTEVPVSDSTISQVFAKQDVDAADDVSHHAIPQYDHLAESGEDLANLLGGEPTHVAPSRHVWSIVAYSAAARHGIEQLLPSLTQGRKRRVEVEGRDVASVAIFVRGEAIETVGGSIVDILWRLESKARYVSGVCSVDEPRWRTVLRDE